MHDYAVFGHDRTTIGRWLGVLAIAIAGGVSQIFTWAYDLSGLDAFAKATVTTGVVYFVLHWIFNKYAWKIPSFDIPDLSGEWTISGKTLNEDGTDRFSWNGALGIEQNWKSISIHLKTINSQSNSYTATLSKRHGPTGGWLLSYSYKNEPEIEQSHELNAHKGYCEVEFNNSLNRGKASYFNSKGRNTYGTIELVRVVK